jgi:uncharacterized protein YbjT (DUF2867 family)
MTRESGATIVVTGSTGRQGGAVTRSLLKHGWRVRAVTRNPRSQKAQALAGLGAEVVQADLEDRLSLEAAFRDAYGVYSVQNPMLSNLETEIKQGKMVADAAKAARIQHLVYGSAGFGAPTGIGSWDSKLQIEAHMKALELPRTILRPVAFMELMTDKDFYPAVSTWHLMPKLMGAARPVGWLSTDDLGVIAATIFGSPEQFTGQDISLVSDVKSIDDCRELYREIMGKYPARFPMPVWMFKRFVGTDLITMWEWLRTAKIDFDTGPTLALHPDALSVEKWLIRYKNRQTH